MNILVTAGATEVPIDRVRAITNVFRGKTGTEIAIVFAWNAWRGYPSPHSVTLLTSNKQLALDTIAENSEPCTISGPDINVFPYRTFDKLAEHMEREVRSGGYDLIIHSAAVSDYRVVNVHARKMRLIQVLPRSTHEQHIVDALPFSEDDVEEYHELIPIERSEKIGSSHDRLFLELERTPKLVECIKRDWAFRGKLVQFKLEVGITDDELIARARAALARSHGDLVVANCLEWMRERALLVGADGSVEKVKRAELPQALIRRFT